MTLLSIVQDVSDATGLTRPTLVVGSGDNTARQMLALLKLEGRNLLRRHDWSFLAKDHEFTTAAGIESYAEPADLMRYVDDTAWDQTNFWRMRGSMTPSEWQFRKNAIIATTTARKRFRVKWDASANGRRIFIDPVPGAAEDIVIEYVSDQYITSAAGTGQNDWEADDDVSLFDETLLQLGLRFRVLQAKGIPYADEELQYSRYLSQYIAEDTPNDPVSLVERNALFVNLPEDGFGT